MPFMNRIPMLTLVLVAALVMTNCASSKVSSVQS